LDLARFNQRAFFCPAKTRQTNSPSMKKPAVDHDAGFFALSPHLQAMDFS
jgi:hypothetical protein